MKINSIIKKYVNQGKRDRKVGRYWSSELYNIKKGRLTPKKFFNPPKIGLGGCRRILTGEAYEMMLEKVFKETDADFESQVKKVISIDDDIELVVKADFVFPDFLIEAKRPYKDYDNIPPWYEFQCESQYRAFHKPIYLGVLQYPFSLKLLPYTPNDDTWAGIRASLAKFHQQIKDYKQK